MTGLHGLLDHLMHRRARQVFTRLQAHLPPDGHLLDVGSGTGHNANCLETQTGLQITETDVTNMNTRGRMPILFDGRTLPFEANAFSCTMLLYVLHYVPRPENLLREIRRVSPRHLIVLQSSYSGRIQRTWLRIREWMEGDVALWFARLIGFVPAGRPGQEALRVQQLFTRDTLQSLFARAGWRVIGWQPEHRFVPGPSRDLFVLAATEDPPSAGELDNA